MFHYGKISENHFFPFVWQASTKH